MKPTCVLGMIFGLLPGCMDSEANQDESAHINTSQQATSCTTLNVYMAPSGSDANSGLSTSAKIKTLSRAQEVIQNYNPACPTVVNIDVGTYYGQAVTWTYASGHQIKFTTTDPNNARPVFDGCNNSGTADCLEKAWFTVAVRGTTNLYFNYLKVQRYNTAISLNGNRNKEAEHVAGNTIYGMYFDKIGNGWTGAETHSPSTAAVRFVNADDTFVRNNHFYNVTNRTNGGALHAIYIAHSSDNNEIVHNVFENISGDALRVRDYSSFNYIHDNRITKAGNSAAYSEWFCDSKNRLDCTKPDECWSWENEFRYNTLDGLYDCSPLPTWTYFETNPAENCTRPDRGTARLHTSGNVRTSEPCSLLCVPSCPSGCREYPVSDGCGGTCAPTCDLCCLGNTCVTNPNQCP